MRGACASSSRVADSGAADVGAAFALVALEAVVSLVALVAVRWARWAAAGREDLAPAPAAPAIASTRSLLRIFDVVFTPSCVANACSSGIRIAAIALALAEPPLVRSPRATPAGASVVLVMRDPFPFIADPSMDCPRVRTSDTLMVRIDAQT